MEGKANEDVQIEEIEEKISKDIIKKFISYRFNRKHIKVDTFLSILNGCEAVCENRMYM